MPHLIEVFISGCPICRETIRIIEASKCPECRLVIYNLQETPEAMAKAEEYGVKATPTIIIDGKIRLVGKPRPEELRQILRT